MPNLLPRQILVSYASRQWTKMAKIIGTAILEHRSSLQGMDDSALASELRALVESGKLEHRGYLEQIQFCEVQLAGRD